MCEECEKTLILIAKYLYRLAEDEGYLPDITDVTYEEAIKIINEIKEIEDGKSSSSNTGS